MAGEKDLMSSFREEYNRLLDRLLEGDATMADVVGELMDNPDKSKGPDVPAFEPVVVEEGARYIGDIEDYKKIEFTVTKVTDKTFDYELTEQGVNTLKQVYGLSDSEIEKLNKHTIKLDSPDTLFNVHRLETGSKVNRPDSPVSRFVGGDKPTPVGIPTRSSVALEAIRRRREELLERRRVHEDSSVAQGSDPAAPPSSAPAPATPPATSGGGGPSTKNAKPNADASPRKVDQPLTPEENPAEEQPEVYNAGATVDRVVSTILQNVDINAEFEPQLFSVEDLPGDIDLSVILLAMYPQIFTTGSEQGYLKRAK